MIGKKSKNRVDDYFFTHKTETNFRWPGGKKPDWKTLCIVVGFVGATSVAVITAIGTFVVRVLQWISQQ